MPGANADPLMLDLDEELGELGTSRHVVKPDPAKDDGDEAGSPLAKIKELNEHAAKHPYVRRAKTVIFFCMALYGLITMLLEFGATFQKHPEFSTDPGDERCIPRFYDAEKFAEDHPAAKVGFWVGAGTVRVAVCANETDDNLDATFAGMVRFDPLAIITPGECKLDSDADVADAVRACVVSGDGPAPSRMAGCAAAFSTTPMPRGVGWSYILKTMPSSPPSPNINNMTTAVPIPAQWNISSYSTSPSSANDTKTGRCRVLVERNDEMPACPYANVRFYERKNVWLALLYIFTALWNLGMVFFELYQLRQFTKESGDHYGDLTYMIAPFDGSVGAFYSLYRFVRRLPELSELPDPSWLQFARSGFTSMLGFGVSLSAMWGCAVTWNVMMFVLFLFSILKFAYDAGSYLKGRLCPDASLFGPKEPMSPGRHERNDTPMPDEDKLGILLYQHARKVVATTQNGVWHGNLQQFASCNAAQRRLKLQQYVPMLPRTDPKSRNQPPPPPPVALPGASPMMMGQPVTERGAAWDWEESDEYVLEVARVAMEHAVEAEKPPSLLQQICCCFFRKTVREFPQWIVEERARIRSVAANANLDAHLVRRRVVTRLVIVDTMLQAVEGGAAHVMAGQQQQGLFQGVFGSSGPNPPPSQQQQQQQPPVPMQQGQQYSPPPQPGHLHHPQQHQQQQQQQPQFQNQHQQQHYQPQPQQYYQQPPPHHHHHQQQQQQPPQQHAAPGAYQHHQWQQTQWQQPQYAAPGH